MLMLVGHMKRNVTYFGYKNHVTVDVKHKLIRDFEVTNASTHDSSSDLKVTFLIRSNSNKKIYADSAYTGEKISDALKSRTV